jgi:hypothetical protein
MSENPDDNKPQYSGERKHDYAAPFSFSATRGIYLPQALIEKDRPPRKQIFRIIRRSLPYLTLLVLIAQIAILYIQSRTMNAQASIMATQTRLTDEEQDARLTVGTPQLDFSNNVPKIRLSIRNTGKTGARDFYLRSSFALISQEMLDHLFPPGFKAISPVSPNETPAQKELWDLWDALANNSNARANYEYDRTRDFHHQWTVVPPDYLWQRYIDLHNKLWSQPQGLAFTAPKPTTIDELVGEIGPESGIEMTVYDLLDRTPDTVKSLKDNSAAYYFSCRISYNDRSGYHAGSDFCWQYDFQANGFSICTKPLHKQHEIMW